jgi:hypothetical protein
MILHRTLEAGTGILAGLAGIKGIDLIAQTAGGAIPLPRSPGDVAAWFNIGLGPMLLLICGMLCAVVVYLFKLTRADSREHHVQRDAMTAQLMAMIQQATASQVANTETLHELSREIREGRNR